MKTTVQKHRDIFRLRIGSDPPVNQRTLRIKLCADGEPTLVKVRKYSMVQLECLKYRVKEFQSLGAIYKNTESSWACDPYVVPKPGPDKWRLPVDL